MLIGAWLGFFVCPLHLSHRPRRVIRFAVMGAARRVLVRVSDHINPMTVKLARLWAQPRPG